MGRLTSSAHTIRRAGASCAVALAILTTGAPSGAARPAAAPSVPACALGEIPEQLRPLLPSALAASERRYAASLTGLRPAERRRAAAAFSTAAAAYLYGMPRVVLAMTVERYPRNVLVGLGRLSTPESRTVVAPNNDTLYSVSQLDLRDGPIVIDAPATAGRYSVLQLLDIDTNVAAYVGSGGARDRDAAIAVVPPDWTGAVPAGVEVVRSPSTLVWLLGRTLVDGDADLPAATALMQRYALTPLAAWQAGERSALRVVTPGGQPPLATPRGDAFLAALTARLAQSPPPARDACALRAFARFGIGAGTTPQPGDAAAIRAGLRAGDRLVDVLVDAEQDRARRHTGGWWVTPADTGRFGTDYARRAVIARVGLGANVPAEALYPVAEFDGRGRPLHGRHDYAIRFAPGQLPPVRAFWSLTLYDRDRGLVANPIDRYAIGDRTPGLRVAPDGSLTIRVSHRPPPGSGRANWLPAPRGPFKLYLRLYEPRPAALDGRWAPPSIERVP